MRNCQIKSWLIQSRICSAWPRGSCTTCLSLLYRSLYIFIDNCTLRYMQQTTVIRPCCHTVSGIGILKWARQRNNFCRPTIYKRIRSITASFIGWHTPDSDLENTELPSVRQVCHCETLLSFLSVALLLSRVSCRSAYSVQQLCELDSEANHFLMRRMESPMDGIQIQLINDPLHLTSSFDVVWMFNSA